MAIICGALILAGPIDPLLFPDAGMHGGRQAAPGTLDSAQTVALSLPSVAWRAAGSAPNKAPEPAKKTVRRKRDPRTPFSPSEKARVVAKLRKALDLNYAWEQETGKTKVEFGHSLLRKLRIRGKPGEGLIKLTQTYSSGHVTSNFALNLGGSDNGLGLEQLERRYTTEANLYAVGEALPDFAARLKFGQQLQQRAKYEGSEIVTSWALDASLHFAKFLPAAGTQHHPRLSLNFNAMGTDSESAAWNIVAATDFKIGITGGFRF